VGNAEKNELKPWLKQQWCLPPKAHGEFVYHMEDVLAVYKRPYDPRFPQVCLDEMSKQLLKDKRERVPMRPGEVEKYDVEYEREGVCQIFVASEPLAGQRLLQVRERRTKKDWAEFVRELLEVHYPQAEKIVLVMDNLNTHSPASFYEAFEPAEAWRLSQKLEIHCTPTHGSWLNMAEIELSVLARQCLAERMPSIQVVQEQVRAWQNQRNHAHATINWRFTAEDARIKLKRLYPSLKESNPSKEP
jgi:DDE superfamily endonuclease